MEWSGSFCNRRARSAECDGCRRVKAPLSNGTVRTLDRDPCDRHRVAMAAFDPHALVTSRHDLVSEGWSSSRIDRALTAGTLRRLHDGVYLDVERTNAGSRNEHWLAVLGGHCARDPGRVLVSHRSAAVLHGFDGFNHLAGFDLVSPRYVRRPTDVLGLPVDVRVPFASGFCEAPAIRSRSFDELVTAKVHWLPVTSIAQTLADIGRFAPVDLVEVALESALRAVAPARPDEWNRLLLDELSQFVKAHSHDRQRSTATLRRALSLRRGDRPTGSYPETVLAQELRRLGLTPRRQPTVQFFTASGVLERRLFPDLGDLNRGAFVEVEGMEGHSSAAQLEHDADRINLLSSVFTVRRFAARSILRNPRDVARSIDAWLKQLPLYPAEWSTAFGRIVRTSEGLDIFQR